MTSKTSLMSLTPTASAAYELKHQQIGKFIGGKASSLISPRNMDNAIIQTAKNSRKKAVKDIFFQKDIQRLEDQFSKMIKNSH